MKPRSLKNLILIFFTGALLIAGLFFVTRKFSAPPPATNPDQLDFRESNQLPTAEDAAKKLLGDRPEEAPSAAVVAMADTLSEAENNIWRSFEEIVKSKNDNDPRLDSELRSLSPALHRAMYRRYAAFPAEDRNSRGLVVFLIARDLRTVEDAAFLKTVYQEPPCLSLNDCATAGEENPHMSGTDQTTMNYPQLAGLFQLERRLTTQPEILKDAALRAEILELLKTAENFPAPAVQEKARQLRRTYGL